MLTAALLSVLAWLVLLVAWGGFWRADQRLPAARPPAGWPEVAALIPARNEAETIGAALASHAASAYPGRLSVIVIDDHSTDATAAIARAAAARSPRPIHVVPAPELPPGWAGKLWALETGLDAVESLAPGARHLLLTDADIEHAPDTLARLVAHSEAWNLALVSLMARLDARGPWAGLLIPAFIFFFQKLYPFRWVNHPARRMAGAAGGCILMRRDAVASLAPIRGALIDDCALARLVKRGPPRRAIWLGLAEREVVSLRDNRALGTVWAMVRRLAFAQLGHSGLLLAGTLAGLALLYLAGPAALLALPLHGEPLAAALGATAWGLSAIAYRPTLSLYDLPAWQAALLPLAALLYGGMTLDSALAHWRGRGGAWKGRTYPASG